MCKTCIELQESTERIKADTERLRAEHAKGEWKQKIEEDTAEKVLPLLDFFSNLERHPPQNAKQEQEVMEAYERTKSEVVESLKVKPPGGQAV